MKKKDMINMLEAFSEVNDSWLRFFEMVREDYADEPSGYADGHISARRDVQRKVRAMLETFRG